MSSSIMLAAAASTAPIRNGAVGVAIQSLSFQKAQHHSS
jgi:hypothetical protein